MTTTNPPPAAETLSRIDRELEASGRERGDGGLVYSHEQVMRSVRKALAAPDDITCAGASGRSNVRDDIALADKIATAAGYTGKNPTLSNCAMGTALTAIEMLLPARPEPVVDGESSFVPGAVWKEAEDDCWTSEVQVVGGHEVVATVHGATEAQAMVRRDLVLQALSREPVVDGAAELDNDAREAEIRDAVAILRDPEASMEARLLIAASVEAMIPPANCSTDSAVRAKAIEDAAEAIDAAQVEEDGREPGSAFAAGIWAGMSEASKIVRALLPTEAR